MNRNMKVLLIGAAIMLFVVGGTVWQVVEVNRSGRSPLAVLFEDEATPAPSPEPTPVTIVLREETPTPEPTPTPTPEPTTEPTPEVTPEPTPDPAGATPTPRPEIVETPPEPTPVPDAEAITLDAASINIQVGDTWRINIAAAPAALYEQEVTWTSGDSSIVQLTDSNTSGVTITGLAAGATTVTISTPSGLSASCSVTVS